MDAYSYIGRGGVFANAETGNIVLLAIRLSEGEWLMALRYLIPIAAFAGGVIIAETARAHKRQISAMHWRQWALMVEILVLCLVAFLPQDMNIIANTLISMVCGIQVAAFAKFHDNAMATTMCTGNLRSGTQAFHQYRHSGDRHDLHRALIYCACILVFILGAMLGGQMTMHFQEKAIVFAAMVLALALVLMFADEQSA